MLYPSFGNALMQIHDEEERVTLCRVDNEFLAEQYRPYGDRFTVAALVPMHTPDEAVAALEHIKSLGSKVALIPSHVHRPLPGQPWPPNDPWADVRIVQWETHGWVDTFGIDSIHDYDPVWAKAVELGLPIAADTAGIGASDRASISNFVFNQIGHSRPRARPWPSRCSSAVSPPASPSSGSRCRKVVPRSACRST